MPALISEDAVRDADVVVIGGGPGGSTAATLLAERGYRVTLLEKDRHPRFHIGESLLPANLPLIERLGVSEEVRAIGMPKHGAEFFAPWLGRGQTFEFKDAWDKRCPYAYHVRRSEFDEILIRRAARAGTTVLEGCRVRDVQFGAGPRPVRVSADAPGGAALEVSARYLIDASGRDTFLATRLGAKRRNRKHNSAAMYGHFRGATRYEGPRAGNISIYWFEHGWFWFIPLADGTNSIGAVVWPAYMKSRAVPLEEFFRDTIALCPPLAERLKQATLASSVEATGNYSYSSDRCYGRNYLLVGDAFAFIDPVFSSGVWLAMNGAAAAVEAVDACLTAPQRARTALREFERVMRRGPSVFSWFIYRVTNPTLRDMFMNPRNVGRVKEAVLSVLAGDIFGRTPIWGSLRLFKAFYYALSLANLRRTASAWRKHVADVSWAPRNG